MNNKIIIGIAVASVAGLLTIYLYKKHKEKSKNNTADANKKGTEAVKQTAESTKPTIDQTAIKTVK